MIDFHCHLDLLRNLEETLQFIDKAGMYVLSVTTTPKAWPGTKRLAGSNPRIKTAIGLHPQIAHERSNELPLLEMILPETRYVGEVGLDGSKESKGTFVGQQKIFESILQMTSKSGDKILSIHSRQAEEAVLDLLKKHPSSGRPVLHWFSGNQFSLKFAVELGCWFSINEAMLRSKKGLALISAMPNDRIVTESDAPFMKVRGASAYPSIIPRAIQSLSRLWRIPVSHTDQILRNNFKQLVTS